MTKYRKQFKGKCSLPGDRMKIYDNHVHTHYGYCPLDEMLPEASIEIAEEAGYGICLVEHAGQLYVNNDDYWSANFMYDPELIYRDETNRMDEYIDFISRYRADYVKIGLELDFDNMGNVTLRDEHENAFDLFLGAIHNIPRRFTDIDEGFLWSLDVFCDFGVDILAHPFRIFKQKKVSRPVHLYKTVAEILYKNDIAAELSYHINEPDGRFFEICIETGVRIALSSDAHKLAEVCDFDKNMKILEEIYDGDIGDIIYTPKSRRIDD